MFLGQLMILVAEAVHALVIQIDPGHTVETVVRGRVVLIPRQNHNLLVALRADPGVDGRELGVNARGQQRLFAGRPASSVYLVLVVAHGARGDFSAAHHLGESVCHRKWIR